MKELNINITPPTTVMLKTFFGNSISNSPNIGGIIPIKNPITANFIPNILNLYMVRTKTSLGVSYSLLPMLEAHGLPPNLLSYRLLVITTLLS